jgi:predicted nucleotidyltransferase
MLSRTVSRVNSMLMLSSDTPLRMGTITSRLGLPHHNATTVALDRLVKTGSVRAEVRHGHTEFEPDRDSPYFRPSLEVAVIDLRLRDLLPDSASVLAIFAFGSVLSGTANQESDLDILIVGKVEPTVVSRCFRPVEAMLSRTLDVIVRSAAETRDALEAGDQAVSAAVSGLRVWGTWS